MSSEERDLKVAQALDLAYFIDNDTKEVKKLNRNLKDYKEAIRDLMLKELEMKKLIQDDIEIEIRPNSSFIMDMLEDKYPELYIKYVKKEKRIVTYTEEEVIFDKNQFKKDHKEEYDHDGTCETCADKDCEFKDCSEVTGCCNWREN